jgi:RNA polymerase sigma factor (sigma-70 family)
MDGLKELTPREREVIRLRFFDENNNLTAAALMGISTSRVSMLATRALRRLAKTRASNGEPCSRT